MENDAIIKKDGKIIGFVRDGIYTTNRIKDKHFFRMLNGYAWTDKGRDEQLIIDINECIKVGQ